MSFVFEDQEIGTDFIVTVIANFASGRFPFAPFRLQLWVPFPAILFFMAIFIAEIAVKVLLSPILSTFLPR